VLFDNVDFADLELPASTRVLRAEVRAFLREELDSGRIQPRLGHTEFDLAFTRRVAAHGWIGMTWPKQYGGQERSYLDRFVVTEEMLAVAAPCAAHWFGDRQTGPSLLRYGSEYQRTRFLPAIVRGEAAFALGMSEPGAGSDLAAVKTRAEKVDGGWRVTGQKVWTSWAHKADAFFVLCRTTPLGDDQKADRHAGLSQLIVEMKSEGVTVRPINFLNGRHQFNEVWLDNVLVPDAMVVGEIDSGWKQVTSELALERSGPERFMTTFPLLIELVRRFEKSDDARALEAIGRLVARFQALRRRDPHLRHRDRSCPPADGEDRRHRPRPLAGAGGHRHPPADAARGGGRYRRLACRSGCAAAPCRAGGRAGTDCRDGAARRLDARYLGCADAGRSAHRCAGQWRDGARRARA